MALRRFTAIALLLCASFTLAAHAKAPPTWDYYKAGNLKAGRSGNTEGALMLLGGGDWPVPACWGMGGDWPTVPTDVPAEILAAETVSEPEPLAPALAPAVLFCGEVVSEPGLLKAGLF